ncbi:glycosyltransferase family 2 protein [Burkholderia sp. RS01]|uniref:glycosyltransferase family 2 protein n=1 Tax=unclassified Burkholderia TaxID=2613784 RepID=UPI0032184EF3
MQNTGTGFTPAVDVVIAVHSSGRPIERAVASAFDGGLAANQDGGVRVSVVCHNIEAEAIRRRLPADTAEQVRWLTCQDGIPSPAGPFNAGIAAADGEYACIMGSDDYLESGALAQWLTVARDGGAAAVIAPQRHADGNKIRTPPVRAGRKSRLDPVRDRLSYRTAPLGLISTKEIQRHSLAFTAGLKTGEDQEFSSRLWFGGGRIDYARGAGHYVVGADAQDRVTYTRRPVTDELSFATRLVASDWFKGLTDTGRRAIVVKLLRVHVFGLVGVRADHGGWSVADMAELAAVARSLLAAAPGAADPMAIADRRLLDTILDRLADPAALVAAAAARRRFGRPETLFARGIRNNLNPESPLRFIAASLLV